MLFKKFKIGDTVKINRTGKGDPLVKLRSVGNTLGTVVEIEQFRIFQYAVKFGDMPPINFADFELIKVNGLEKAAKRKNDG